MNNKYISRVILILIGLTLARGMIYGLIIPFDRAPDENFYFRLIKAKQLQLAQASEEEKQRVAAEFEVTKHVLLYPETTSPPTVEDFSGLTLLKPPPPSEIYYGIGARLLQLLSLPTLRDEIYVMRGFSALCGAIIVLIAFVTTRELFPQDLFLQVGVPLFITFIPQFSAMNGVINNDKLAELFAALLFLVIVKLLKHGLSGWYILAYLLLAGLALLSKRTAVFSVPLFLVLLFIYYWKASIGIKMHLILFSLLLGIAVAGNSLAGLLHDTESVLNHYLIWLPPHKLKAMLSQEFLSLPALKYQAKFLVVLYWSFWGVFGYMTIHLHHFWYVLAACGQVLAIGGIVKLIVLLKMKKTHFLARWQIQTLYLFGASIVFVFLMILYRSIISRAGGEPLLAQGRRFFTVIVPISVLTLLGFQQIFPPKYQRVASAIGIVTLLVLDAVCLSNYLLLNFHFISLF